MSYNNAIITIQVLETDVCRDIEVPLDISASELCEAIFQKYFPERYGDIRRYYLKSERPVALLRGEKTLREYGLRDGSIINITK